MRQGALAKRRVKRSTPPPPGDHTHDDEPEIEEDRELPFKDWVKESLITGHRVSPLREGQAGDWCGFSIYMPIRQQAYDRYKDTYPIYSQTKLGSLCQKLVDSITAMREREKAKQKEKDSEEE